MAERLLDRWPASDLTPCPTLWAQGQARLGNWRAITVSALATVTIRVIVSLKTSDHLYPEQTWDTDNKHFFTDKQRTFVLRAGQSNEPGTMQRNISKHFYQELKTICTEGLEHWTKIGRLWFVLDSKFPPAWLAGKSSDTGDRLSCSGSQAGGFTNIFWETNSNIWTCFQWAGIPV